MCRPNTKASAGRWVCKSLALAAILISGASAVAEPLALVGGTVFQAPRDVAIENAVVVLRDGEIVSVGPLETVEIPART